MKRHIALLKCVKMMMVITVSLMFLEEKQYTYQKICYGYPLK